ncbi:MAG: tetratricopeptide repeat protein, partial [Deltaproteobacteria bacterium]|nr:tetratricopeptide repeat protein [Deltaproteobacteria bacterium]
MRYRAIRPVKTAKTVWIFLALLIPCASSSQVKPLPPPPARAPSPAFPVKPVPPAAAAPSPAMPEELESARGTGPSQTYAQSLMPLQEPEQYRSLMSGPMALRGAAAATVLDKAFALYQEAEFEKAVSELEKIIAEMQKRQQKIREAVATDFLGLVYQRQGSLLAAMRRHRDAIDLLAREQVSAALEPRVNAMNNLAVAYYFRGEYQEAESWLAKAIDEASASPQTKARALNNRGLIRQELGNPREALADFDEAEGSAGADPVLRAQVLNNLARLRGSQGRMDDAVAKLKEAQRLAREAGDAILEANILDSWGEVLLKADRPREALQKLSEADALERKAQAPLIRVAISWNMGRALAKLGQRDNARASYDTAVKLARQFSLAALHREALASRGDLYLQSGKLDEAIEDYKNAVELAQNIRGALRGQTEKEFAQAAQRVYENLVRALIRRGKSGDVELALNYLDQSKSDMLRRELLKVNPELQDKIAERSIQGARGLLDKEAALSALLQQELLRKGPKGRIDRIRRELEETRRDYLAALDELNQKYGSRYTEYAGISPLTFGQSASWLAPGQLLVIFLPTEDGLYYFLVSKESGVEFR